MTDRLQGRSRRWRRGITANRGPFPSKKIQPTAAGKQRRSEPYALVPPSTVRLVPVIYDASGPATNATSAANLCLESVRLEFMDRGEPRRWERTRYNV